MLHAISQATGLLDRIVVITITEIERANDGGAVLVISAVAETDTWEYRQLQNWKVTADRWGHVKKMSPNGPIQYIQVPIQGTSRVDQRNGTHVITTREEPGEPEPLWERTFKNSSETTVAIDSSSRYWTE
jgi:hypothetical protein